MFKKNKKVDINTFMDAGNFLNNVVLKHCFTLNALLASKFIYNKLYCNNKSIYKEACPSNNILDNYIQSRDTEKFIIQHCTIAASNANPEDRDEYNNFLKNASDMIDYYRDNIDLGYDPMYINKCLGVEPDLNNLINVIVEGVTTI